MEINCINEERNIVTVGRLFAGELFTNKSKEDYLINVYMKMSMVLIDRNNTNKNLYNAINIVNGKPASFNTDAKVFKLDNSDYEFNIKRG